jgi:hypothetical protein
MKTLAQYTTEYGTPELALAAIHRDLMQAESARQTLAVEVEDVKGQNAKARAFVRVYKPLVKELGLSEEVSDSDAEQTKAQVKHLKEKLEQANTQSPLLGEILAVMGIAETEPAKVKEAALKLTGTVKEFAAKEQGLLVREAAVELGYDATKLGQLRGVENLTKRSTKFKDEKGVEFAKDVFGIAGEGDAFTPLKEFASPWEAALLNQTNAQAKPDTRPIITPQKSAAGGPVGVTPQEAQAAKKASGEYTI